MSPDHIHCCTELPDEHVLRMLVAQAATKDFALQA
jgi:hypothetical protein